MRVRDLAVVLPILVTCGLVEVGLRLRESATDDRALNDRRITDPILGHRMRPNRFYHDARGFRNDTAPEHADIVVVGDSQTWGMNAHRSDAWPQQLQSVTGRSVYNMGMVAWGPAQYMSVIPDALTMSPSVLIVTLYVGNDWLDAATTTYQLDHYRPFRQPDFTYRPSERVKAADRIDAAWAAASIGWWTRLGVGRLFVTPLIALRDFHRLDSTNPHLVLVDHTAIGLSGPLARLDLSDPLIAEGARLTLIYLDRIRRAVTSARLVIVLFPHKATVYAGQHPRLQPLVDSEHRATSQIMGWCRDTHVACLDPTEALQPAASRGEAIYPMSGDVHPNAAGYRLVAQAVANWLRR